jgi:hypothetical protein
VFNAAVAPIYPTAVYKIPIVIHATMSARDATETLSAPHDNGGAVTTNAKLKSTGPTALKGLAPTQNAAAGDKASSNCVDTTDASDVRSSMLWSVMQNLPHENSRHANKTYCAVIIESKSTAASDIVIVDETINPIDINDTGAGGYADGSSALSTFLPSLSVSVR